jgi:quercetin dioxygenase-like cupin family protein
MNRRKFISSTVAASAFPFVALYGAEGGSKKRALLQQALPDLKLENWQCTALELTFEPGVSTAKHHHPGFVLGYVLEGEFRFQIEGEDARVLRAGEMFYEPPGAVHLLSESASQSKPVRVLALVFGAKGAPVATPE